MKKIAIALALALMLSLSGCFYTSTGSGGTSGGVYANADDYNIGDFTYAADQVQTLDIHWLSGSVELIQSDKATLAVSETCGSLDQDHQLRWLLKDGVLTIQFWKSNFSSLQDLTGLKELTVEVPKGLVLQVNSISAPITAGDLEPSEAKFSTVSGALELNSLSCTEFTADTNSGNVTVGTLSTGPAKVGTTSGIVSLGLAQCTGLDVSTVSGSVELTPLGDLKIYAKFNSVSGKVRVLRDVLNINAPGGCPVTVKTTSGDLTVK